MDEFGPFNLQPCLGRQWTGSGGKDADPERERCSRMWAACTRIQGVRHLFATLDLCRDKLYGHIKKRKRRGELLEFCRYLRTSIRSTYGSRLSATILART